MSDLPPVAELTKRTPSRDATSFEDEKLDHGADGGEPFYYDLQSGMPLPDLSAEMPVEHQALTFRAIIVGCALGTVVQASNLYLGLKTGFTVSSCLCPLAIGAGCLIRVAFAGPCWLQLVEFD